jgi:signal transduction histidine kinase
MVSRTVVKISIIDTGVGMSQSLIKAIYDVLERPEKAALFEK